MGFGPLFRQWHCGYEIKRQPLGLRYHHHFKHGGICGLVVEAASPRATKEENRCSFLLFIPSHSSHNFLTSASHLISPAIPLNLLPANCTL